MEIQRDGKKRTIGRIVGGAVWPNEHSKGFAVVIAEEKIPEIVMAPDAEERFFQHVLQEYEEGSLGIEPGIRGFVQALVNLGKWYSFSTWVARVPDSVVETLESMKRYGDTIIRPVPLPWGEQNNVRADIEVLGMYLDPANPMLAAAPGVDIPLLQYELDMLYSLTERTQEYECPALSAAGYACRYLNRVRRRSNGR